MMAARLCEAWGTITVGLIQGACDACEGDDWEGPIAEDRRVRDLTLDRLAQFIETLAVLDAQSINHTLDSLSSGGLDWRLSHLCLSKFVGHFCALGLFSFDHPDRFMFWELVSGR
jgi:hypothetical protein